jgi:hypothetical protein
VELEAAEAVPARGVGLAEAPAAARGKTIMTIWQGWVLGLLIAIFIELMAIFAAVLAHYVRHRDD